MAPSKRAYAAVSTALAVVLSAVVVRDIYADWILEGKRFWTTLAENALPLILGVGLLFVGYWVYRNRNRSYARSVAQWQVGGAVGTLALVGTVVGFQTLQAELKPFVIVVQTTIGGTVAGTAIGYAVARTEESLAEAEYERDRSVALFENASAEIAEVRARDDGLLIERANEAFEAAFDEDAEGDRLSEIVGHADGTLARIRECTDSGESVERETEIRAGPERRYYQLRIVPFGDDSAYVLYTDVTELRETRDELSDTVARLQSSNARLEEYEQIIEAAPVGIVKTDPADHTQFSIVNDAFLELFGADSVADLQERPLEVMYADPKRRQEILSRIDETGSVVDEEVAFQTLDGEEFYGSLTALTIGQSDDQALIAIVFDITEQVSYKQELEESNERLEDFAYIASHDLQEPLRTVSRYAEIVQEDYGDELDETGVEFLETVVTGAERMSSMISGLLDYSRVTTRGGEFDTVDTEAVVEEIQAELRALAADHDGTITVESLPTVEADRDQIWQVFQNLVKNALEHSGEDPVTVTVSGTETADGVRFEVADDGPGIDPYIEDEIFKIFKSGENYQTESEARGIGLAIVERIVDRHGGEISVDSEPGKGSIFVFTIPK